MCPDVPELFRLWSAGVTIDQIGERFGVSKNIVRTWRQRYKLPPRRTKFARVEHDPTPDEIAARARECRERHFAQRRSEKDECSRIKSWRHRQGADA